MTKKEAIQKVHHYWDLCQNIEACPDYDEELFKQTFPGVFAAWEEYKSSKQTLDALIDYEMGKDNAS